MTYHAAKKVAGRKAWQGSVRMLYKTSLSLYNNTIHIIIKSVSIEETKTDSIDSVLFGYMTNLVYVLLPKGIS